MSDVKSYTERVTPAARRILDTASELFYVEGIRAVGVDRISEEAGVAKMTLYNNFGSKDELVAEYLRERDRRWRAWIEASAKDRQMPEERLLAVFDVLGEWLESEVEGYRGCAFINATSEIPDPDHPARAVAREHKQWMRGLFERLAAEAGAADPAELADRIVILFEGAIVTTVTRADTHPVAHAKAAAEVLLRASAGAER